MSDGEDIYVNEVVRDVIEYRFRTVPGVTADELYAALKSGLAEVTGYEVVGPDKVKMAELKAYRRTSHPGTSSWIRLGEDEPSPAPNPQDDLAETDVPSGTRGSSH